GDSTWWDLHLDENYIGTDADGRTTTRTEAIQLHNSPDLKYDNIHLSDMSIRTYNKNTVIINGKSDIDGTFKGQNIGGSYSFVRGLKGNGCRFSRLDGLFNSQLWDAETVLHVSG